MNPTKELPAQFTLFREINLERNHPLLLVLNLIGVFLFILMGWGFLILGIYLRPDITAGKLIQVNTFLLVLGIISSFALVIILHELVHGLFFWIITGDRPDFGFKGAYAYTAAPEWYLPRVSYFIVGLAPFILITTLGVALIPVMPQIIVLPLLLALTTNAAGSIGDLLVIGWLATLRSSMLICDHGDAIKIYTVQTYKS